MRFLPAEAATWVGNFQPAGGACNLVLEHPNGRDVLVVAGGSVYLVDPRTRTLHEFVYDNVAHVIPVPELGLLVLGDDLGFVAINAGGIAWQSPRISWDGLRNLQLVGTKLVGEAYAADGDTWRAFDLDLRNGTCENSIYVEDMRRAVAIKPLRRLRDWLGY